jgi:hypothetical protein
MTSRRHATAGFWITVALIAVLVRYPASAGPALLLIKTLPESAREGYVTAYYVFYTPLIWLCDQVKWVEAVMDWYSDLWVPAGQSNSSVASEVGAGGLTPLLAVSEVSRVPAICHRQSTHAEKENRLQVPCGNERNSQIRKQDREIGGHDGQFSCFQRITFLAHAPIIRRREDAGESFSGLSPAGP